jgi:RNA polymerase sigma-70 factor (ECF subfamily)
MALRSKTLPPAYDLDEIVARFRPIVGFKVKKSLGGGNPDWEDMADEILMQAIAKIKSGEFRGESSVGTFIYTIASRRIVDYIRQKSKVLKEIPEPHASPDPHDRVEGDERAQQLALAVHKLKTKYRDVLKLYYYQELPREEVAHRLGITPAKVSERVNYALKLLRKALEKQNSIFRPGTRLKE